MEKERSARKRRLMIGGIAGVCVAAFLIITGSYLLMTLFSYMNRLERDAGYLSEAGYMAVLGVDAHEKEESFYEVYGEPESRERWMDTFVPDRGLEKWVYPGFEVIYLVETRLSGEEFLRFLQLTITDESYRFGVLNIGLGSSRIEVRIAYLLDPKLDAEEREYSAELFPGVSEGFYGECYDRILFRYEKGRVVSMAYRKSPN